MNEPEAVAVKYMMGQDKGGLQELESLIANNTFDGLAKMELEHLAQPEPDMDALARIRVAAIIRVSLDEDVTPEKCLAEQMYDYFEANGAPEKWLCTLDQFVDISVDTKTIVSPGFDLYGCILELCATEEESGPVVAEKPRSTEKVILVSPGGFNQAMEGLKTATSRLGDRRAMWPQGAMVTLRDNGSGDETMAQITYNILTTLEKVNDTVAGTVGCCSASDHRDEFRDIYPGSDYDTEISIVGFRVL